MRAEEFLSRAYRLDQQIQSKVAQLSRLRACICGTGVQYGDVKVQSSRQDSRVENAVVKILYWRRNGRSTRRSTAWWRSNARSGK